MARTFGLDCDTNSDDGEGRSLQLRRFRQSAGLSLRQVVHALGISHVHVSRVEREVVAFFHRRHWPALAGVLGVDEIQIAQAWYNRRLLDLAREREEATREFRQMFRDLR